MNNYIHLIAFALSGEKVMMELQLQRNYSRLISLISIFVAGFIILLRYPETAFASGPSLLWETQDFNTGSYSPVVGPDGTIYVSGFHLNLAEEGIYAVNPDGTIKWVYETRSATSTPAIGDDGSIYTCSEYGVIYALTSDGALKWSYETEGNITGSPAVGCDGSIYAGSMDGFLYALSPDGELVWRHITGRALEADDANWDQALWLANVRSSPVVGPDGTVYVASGDSYIYAISPTGVRKWAFKTSYPDWGGDIAPAFGPDGTIYFGSKGNYLYAINPDGTEKWARVMYGVGNDSPAVAADGSIYKVGETGLYCLNPDGTTRWEFSSDYRLYSSPAIGHDGTVYVAGDRALYAVTPEGRQKWTYELDNRMASCPALTENGTIYLTAETLIALETDTRGYQPDAPWPAFTFSPKRSIAAEDITLPEHYAVRGQVAMPDSTPLVEVKVSADGLMAVTDEYGFYSFQLPNGSYTITFHVNSAVIPGTRDIIVDGADVFVDLYGTGGEQYTVSGRLRPPAGALSGAMVYTALASTRTDADGRFSLQVPSGEYRIGIDAGAQCFPGSVDVIVEQEAVDIGDIPVNSIDWTYEVESWYHNVKSAVGLDGTVYYTTHQQIHALSPDGTLKTNIPIGTIVGDPVIGSDGTVYVADMAILYAFNADLSAKWSFPVPESGAGYSPAIGRDGTLYFGSTENVYAVTEDGELQWTCPVGDNVYAPTAVSPDGIIYATSNDHKLYAIDRNGTLLWEFTTGSPLMVTPLIADDGTVYIGSYDNYFYAVNPDGTLQWKYRSDGAISSDAILGDDGTIYFASQNYQLYALNPDGTLNWEYYHDDYIHRNLWVCPNTQELWVCDSDETLAFHTDGTLSWRAPVAYMMPVPGADGTVYAVSETDRTCSLHAISIGDVEPPVHVSEKGEKCPAAISPAGLGAAGVYPNPFNAAVSIDFALLQDAHVAVDIFSVTGQHVGRLLDDTRMAGHHRLTWDGTGHATGMYFVRIAAGNSVRTAKMLLVK